MITALLIKALCSFLSFVGGLLPSVPGIPVVNNPITPYAGEAGRFLVGLHNYVAVGAVFAGAGFLLVVAGVIAAIRLARIVVSLMTGGGGSAA